MENVDATCHISDLVKHVDKDTMIDDSLTRHEK